MLITYADLKKWIDSLSEQQQNSPVVVAFDEDEYYNIRTIGLITNKHFNSYPILNPPKINK